MSEKRSLREVIREAQAEKAAWPESMKQLSQFRRDEIRARKTVEPVNADGTKPAR